MRRSEGAGYREALFVALVLASQPTDRAAGATHQGELGPAVSASTEAAQSVWAEVRQEITDPQHGAWIIERQHVVSGYSASTQDPPHEHLRKLAGYWQPTTTEGTEWLTTNGFDDPDQILRHPLLRDRVAWSSKATEFLKRTDQGQVHIVIEPASQSNPDQTRRTIQYRYDGMIVEQESESGLTSATKIFAEDRRNQNRIGFAGMKATNPSPILAAKGGLLSLERLLLELDAVFAFGRMEPRQGQMRIGPNEMTVRIPLLSPSSRDSLGVPFLPYGFQSIPGYLVVRLTHEQNAGRGRVQLRWTDALDSIYCEESLEWREGGCFDLRQITYFPGTTDEAILDVMTSIPDVSEAAAQRSCRWVPRIGERVSDHRGENPTRYRIDDSESIPSLETLEVPTIYERSLTSPSEPGLQYRRQLDVAESLAIADPHPVSEITLGELPFGDTPIRAQLFNETEEYIGIVSLQPDCGCIDVHADSATIDPGGMCFLYGTIAVRSAGKSERAIRLEYVVGTSPEVRVHTVILRYDGKGSLAVQPEHTYLGTRLAGTVATVDIRVLIPEGGGIQDLAVLLDGRKCSFDVVKSESGGRHSIHVEVPIPGETFGAIDRHLLLSYNGISAISTVSCSVAPTAELAEDWPAWRLPLSRTGRAEILLPRFSALGVVSSDTPPSIEVMQLENDQGLVLTRIEESYPGGEVQRVLLRTKFGPLRILVR